ncbi:ATP-binding protein [Geodermatophilus sp. URMC 62]|uniref:ATP-binding protein n=1 Tax=Geodermatophilus sp. URMC 62 TaxID=3423414 RepID=UPI00406D0F9D
MEQTRWPRRPLPAASLRPPLTWERELHTPIDLTVSRNVLGRMVRTRWLRHHAPVDVDELLLVYEELTSNGLRHGRSPVRVCVTATGRSWLVDVIDSAVEQPPVPAIDRDPADGGLGLTLVVQLCRTYGWTVEEDRKHVWACLHAA